MDYRYFPDPDLPPLEVDGDLLARLSAGLPALPAALRARFHKVGGLGDEAIEFLMADRQRAESFATIAGSEDGKLVANYMLLDPDGRVPLRRLRRLAELQRTGTISGSAAKRVVAEMIARDADPDPIIEALGLIQVSDTGALGAMAAEIMAANPGQVAAYRAGKANLIGFFVGQLMKKSGGKANPQLATTVLKKLLES